MNLTKLDLKEKVILLRVDYNVPIQNGNITDTTRIDATLPTIKYILEHGGKIVLLSHLGRPLKDLTEKGNIQKKLYTLKPIADYLHKILHLEVAFVKDSIEENDFTYHDILKTSDVALMENTRFYEGETSGSEQLAKKMSALGEIYVNDAFGTAHRRHASTATVAQFYDKKQKGFGFLMEGEIEQAHTLLRDSRTPFMAIIGGAKISDKIELLHSLILKVDKILIGGGMAYTFIKALGGNVGNSLVELDKLESALEIFKKARANQVQVLLPMDSVVCQQMNGKSEIKTVLSREIEEGWMGLDIGEESITHFTKEITKAKRIFWNGPMGVFENHKFSKGTFAIAHAVAQASMKNDAFSLIGGGDSVAAVNTSGYADKVSFISTGGGAMLEFIQGNTLPGIEAIET